MKDHEKVIEGLQTFVNWWMSFVDSKGVGSTYANWIMQVIQYLEQMIIALKTPCVEQEDALHDFWPGSLPSLVVVCNILSIITITNLFTSSNGKQGGGERERERERKASKEDKENE